MNDDKEKLGEKHETDAEREQKDVRQSGGDVSRPYDDVNRRGEPAPEVVGSTSINEPSPNVEPPFRAPEDHTQTGVNLPEKQERPATAPEQEVRFGPGEEATPERIEQEQQKIRDKNKPQEKPEDKKPEDKQSEDESHRHEQEARSHKAEADPDDLEGEIEDAEDDDEFKPTHRGQPTRSVPGKRRK